MKIIGLQKCDESQPCECNWLCKIGLQSILQNSLHAMLFKYFDDDYIYDFYEVLANFRLWKFLEIQ